MYAVIFRAEVRAFDEEYSRRARELRDLALSDYGCIEFVSATEGATEIAISYWENEEDILRWRRASEHRYAQDLGKRKWYESYQVQVTRISRSYRSDD